MSPTRTPTHKSHTRASEIQRTTTRKRGVKEALSSSVRHTVSCSAARSHAVTTGRHDPPVRAAMHMLMRCWGSLYGWSREVTSCCRRYFSLDSLVCVVCTRMVQMKADMHACVCYRYLCDGMETTNGGLTLLPYPTVQCASECARVDYWP